MCTTGNLREGARQTIKDVEGLGAKAIAIKADISDHQQVKSMIDQSLDAFGKADILVNNAGTEGPYTPMIDTTPEEFLETFNIHFMGAYHCTYLLLPHMRKYERGDIQVISSRQADYCPPNFVPYNVAKSAQDTLAKTLAKEERYNGIRVNSIAPGFVETDMARGRDPGDDGASRHARGGQEDASWQDYTARGHWQPVRVSGVAGREPHIGGGDVCAGRRGFRATSLLFQWPQIGFGIRDAHGNSSQVGKAPPFPLWKGEESVAQVTYPTHTSKSLSMASTSSQ